MITVNGQQVEEDAYLMQSVIDFEASTSELCPFPKESIQSLTMEQVVDAYGRVSKNKELMIVEGVELITAGFLYGLSGFDIVERLKSDFILLCNADLLGCSLAYAYTSFCERIVNKPSDNNQ